MVLRTVHRLLRQCTAERRGSLGNLNLYRSGQDFPAQQFRNQMSVLPDDISIKESAFLCYIRD